MTYLIVKCNALGDQWECDADRKPICLTDDCSTYGFGYEAYELKADNTFKLIKEYEETVEEGIMVIHYDQYEEDDFVIVEKIPNADRDNMKLFKKLYKKYQFPTEDWEDAKSEMKCCGSTGTVINNRWWVIGEYYDNQYPQGY